MKKSLVGRIYRENTVNFTGLKQTMKKLWFAEGDLIVIEIKNKMFQFVFSRDDERTMVLEKQPWTFDNQLLVLHPLRQDIEADEVSFLSS